MNDGSCLADAGADVSGLDAEGPDATPDDGPTNDAFDDVDTAADSDVGMEDSGADVQNESGNDAAAPASEYLLFEGSELQFQASERGFFPLIEPGAPLPVDDWSTPQDFCDGEMRVRYAITGPPNQVGGKLQTCIWTMGNEDADGKNYYPESCADQVVHNGVGTYYGTKLVPSTWWKNGGEPLVFAYPERFLIRVVLRGASGCNVTNYDVAGACWEQWPQYENMKFRATLVMVAAGETFSGWSNYP